MEETFAKNANAVIELLAAKFGIDMAEIVSVPLHTAMRQASAPMGLRESGASEVFYADAPAVVCLTTSAPEKDSEDVRVDGKARLHKITLPSLTKRLEAYERDSRAAEEIRLRRGVKSLAQTPSAIEDTISRDPFVAGTHRKLRDTDRPRDHLEKKKMHFKKTRSFKGAKATSRRTPLQISRDLIQLHMEGYEESMRETAIMAQAKLCSKNSAS